jgi:hypothetical protein
VADDLDALIRKAFAAFNALPPEAQEAMMRDQRESWVRAEMKLGRESRASAALSPASVPTVRVRIAVGIDSKGRWDCGGCSRYKTDREAIEEGLQPEWGDVVYFVEADIPRPAPNVPTTVAGKVEGA